MHSKFLFGGFFVLSLSFSALGSPNFFSIDSTLRDDIVHPVAEYLGEVAVGVPAGWDLKQSAVTSGVYIRGYANKSTGGYVTLYAFPESRKALKDYFDPKAQTSNPSTQSVGSFRWDILNSLYQGTSREDNRGVYATGFSVHHGKYDYVGFATGGDSTSTEKAANAFMSGIFPSRSLTDGEYAGKKYYFGWGAAMGGDPTEMHNEVKYDVLHTHDIFTKEVGGSYVSNKLLGYKEATGSKIREIWKQIKDVIKPSDMYVQYSSGHGSTSGLAVGVSYDDIRDNALSYGAKETVIYIMACHSGGLVDSFNKKKSEWQNYQDVGRTLFVMGSSKTSENSSTGPDTDPDEAAGVTGSAGSAFGHSLWKSLIGYADGVVDGVKDGFLTLEEIKKYTIKRTLEVGDHTPVMTGAYNANLIMNKVPPKAYLDALEHSTEGLTDEEVTRQIQALDRAMRVN